MFQAQLAAMDLSRKFEDAKLGLFKCEAVQHLSVRRRLLTGTAGAGKTFDSECVMVAVVGAFD